MNKKIKSLVLSLALLVSSAAPVFAADVTRIAGSNGYETAINVSKKYYTNPDAVIVASGEKYPDALLGGSLATQINAPIILTNKFNTSEKVIDEINRLSPKIIYFLGGFETISNSNINKIVSETNIPYLRIAGKNRYETAGAINELRNNLFYANPEEDLEVVTTHYFTDVSGNNFYDALYCAPYYGLVRTEYGMLLYLVLTPEKTIRDTDRYTAHVVGDINVIFDDPSGFNYITHTKGKNKYETSVLIAQLFKKRVNNNLDTIVLTSGEAYPDGLSSAGVSAAKRAPVILTSKNKLDPSVINFIKKNNIKNIVIVGGENSVSKSVENELRALN